MSPLIIENTSNKTKLFFVQVLLSGTDNVAGVSKVLSTVDLI